MLTLKHDTMLGNIPKDWDVKPLKALLEKNTPGDWGDDSGPHMVPVLRSTNLTNERMLNLSDIAVRALKPEKAQRLAPRKGDILLERSGGGPDQPVGRVGYVSKDLPGYAFSNFLHLLRPDSTAIDPVYLSWVLLRVNRTGRILRLEQQTTQMRNLNFRDYLNMPLPLPPPDEQGNIARILDAVDDSIEKTSQGIQQAKTLLRALQQRFFFDALGETAYADRPTKRLPNGWQLLPTGALLSTEPKNGVSPKAYAQPPGTTTFSIAAVRDGHIDLCNAENLKYVQIPDKTAEVYRVQRGDVLIVRGNANPDLVGKAGIVDSFPDGCIYPDITKRVTFTEGKAGTVSQEFAVIAWNHSVVHNQVLRRAKTSNGTLKINSRDVKEIVMPVPPPKEQARIVGLVKAAENRIDSLARVLAATHDIRCGLLQDLLTGAVRVKASLFQVAEAV